MEYTVIFYETENGRCPGKEFLENMQDKPKGKALKWLEKLEEFGPALPRPYADVVLRKIRELRLIFGSNQYRFLYFFHGKEIIITHGFVKKTDKVLSNEIQRAENTMNDYLRRFS
jgi:phage-related protein